LGSSTALLVFHHSPEQEARIKDLAGQGSKKGTVLAMAALSAHTHSVAEASGLPVHYILSDKQVGRSFGERLTNAFQRLFRQGYDKVIAIGNDHPGLTSAHLNTAASELQQYDHVLGPSTDGGFYLIGIRREHFRQLPFQNLPWQTSALKDTYHSVAKTLAHGIQYLSPLQDLDQNEDLKALWPASAVLPEQRMLFRWLKSQLLSLFTGPILYTFTDNKALLTRLFDSRGPPSCFSV
jgi:glycosyltransferase A (GT-A) superfamily protein (DUF2064 family)